MLIGYVRVSKADGSQTLEPQRDALLAGGVDPSRIYEDLASGRHDARPGLTACLKALQPGNTLVIWKLDRLGRSLRYLVQTVCELTARGIGLKVLTGEGAMIGTTTASGRLMFGIFAALAEFERELIVERTRAGVAAAQTRGKHSGMRFEMTPKKLRLLQKAMSKREKFVLDFVAEIGILKATAHRYVGRDGKLRPTAMRVLEIKGAGEGSLP